MNNKEKACRELLRKIRSGKIKTQSKLEKEKVIVSKKYLLDFVIRNSDISALTRDLRIKKLLKITKGTMIESIVFLAVHYGMRRIEIAGLRWKDINFFHTVSQIAIKKFLEKGIFDKSQNP